MATLKSNFFVVKLFDYIIKTDINGSVKSNKFLPEFCILRYLKKVIIFHFCKYHVLVLSI
jgi:hypothetical protein